MTEHRALKNPRIAQCREERKDRVMKDVNPEANRRAAAKIRAIPTEELLANRETVKLPWRRFTVGQRVELTRDVDRFPDFIAPAGLTGRVVEITADTLRVLAAEQIHGAEQWGNEIIWTAERLDEAAEDLQVIA